MTRLSLLVACLFASTALSSCASEALSETARADAPLQEAAKNPITDLEGGVRQAQMLRLAGHYDEAVHALSQMMLVAADDPRVVGEYGKTLAQMGRSKEAAQFLTRAVELSPGDWTLYSALGVAYDESGDSAKAASAYQQALTIKPEEPSVLNNFALSRLMASDPKGAGALAERAAAAGGRNDAKIARNLAMIENITEKSVAVAAEPKPEPVAALSQPPRPAPTAPVQNAPLPAVARKAPAPFVSVPPGPALAQRAPSGAPRALGPIQASPDVKAPVPSGVVMQRVPVDPLAGPVKPRHAAPKLATAAPSAKETPKPDAKAAIAKAADKDTKDAAKPARPAAIARTEAPKPDARPKADVAKAAVAKAEAKPARPADKKDAAPKDSVPALRMTAAAY